MYSYSQHFRTPARWTGDVISESKFQSILARSSLIEIIPPPSGKVRSRKVVKRSNFMMTTKYPSWKMKRMLECESNNELCAYRIFDADPEITNIFDQPFELIYELDGKRHKHFPDVLTEANTGKTIWEIKQEPADEDIDIHLRSDVLASLFAERGISYRLAGGNDFLAEPLLSNSMLLLEYGRRELTEGDIERASNFFERNNYASWNTFNITGGTLLNRQVLARLVLMGELKFNTETEVQYSSKFSLSTSRKILLCNGGI